ncbi:hypothetical protein JCM6882_008863 [Rhodosporidiobolus microsporus]
MDQQHPPTTPASSDAALALLHSVYPPHLFAPSTASSNSQGRPFVTLTYAQSLDGKIAGPRGKQIRLSGEESMALTHRLRELHDSILVGVGTVLNDDPQLTARIPDLLPLSSQPAPIILDSTLRSPSSCKLLRNARCGVGKWTTVVHAPALDADTLFVERSTALEEAGAAFLEVERDASGHLSLSSMLSHPTASQVFGRSLMVEGGASVITSFLASGLVDLVFVTVAPVLVGSEGVSVTQPGIDLPELEHLKTEAYGKDTVFICRPKKRQ